MIELRDVSVGYGNRPVLSRVSLAFPPGKVTILLGPNGCGKSTLIRSALGLQPLLSGMVFYDGVPVTEMKSREIAKKAAYLAQSRNMPSISGYKMVLHGRFPYLGYPRRYRPEDQEMVKAALEQADAGALARRFLPELSGGERQKIYLAMALAQDTQTVFFDEPTTYLDVGHQMRVMETAHTLAARGTAVVLVLHDLCLALRTGDALAVFSEGQLLKTGAPEEIYHNGIIEAVFGVSVKRVETPEGWRYFYC